ncbi:hypothetical protein [Plantactinospora veratri]
MAVRRCPAQPGQGYPDSRLALCVRLGSSLAEAYRDLHALNPAGAPAATVLSERFLGWVPGHR